MNHIIKPFDNRKPHTKETYCGLTIWENDITKYEAEFRIKDNRTKSICKNCLKSLKST